MIQRPRGPDEDYYPRSDVYHRDTSQSVTVCVSLQVQPTWTGTNWVDKNVHKQKLVSQVSRKRLA